MKDKVEKNEIILDTSGTECPIPVLKARNLCQTLSSGAIVKVISVSYTHLTLPTICSV